MIIRKALVFCLFLISIVAYGCASYTNLSDKDRSQIHTLGVIINLRGVRDIPLFTETEESYKGTRIKVGGTSTWYELDDYYQINKEIRKAVTPIVEEYYIGDKAIDKILVNEFKLKISEKDPVKLVFFSKEDLDAWKKNDENKDKSYWSSMGCDHILNIYVTHQAGLFLRNGMLLGAAEPVYAMRIVAILNSNPVTEKAKYSSTWDSPFMPINIKNPSPAIFEGDQKYFKETTTKILDVIMGRTPKQ